jgi:hypothetical protein
MIVFLLGFGVATIQRLKPAAADIFLRRAVHFDEARILNSAIFFFLR